MVGFIFILAFQDLFRAFGLVKFFVRLCALPSFRCWFCYWLLLLSLLIVSFFVLLGYIAFLAFSRWILLLLSLLVLQALAFFFSPLFADHISCQLFLPLFHFALQQAESFIPPSLPLSLPHYYHQHQCHGRSNIAVHDASLLFTLLYTIHW